MEKNNKTLNMLHPGTITGLIDAEGSLGISLIKNAKRKTGYIITFYLEIGLNKKDKILLETVKSTLGVGSIFYKAKDETYRWKVSNVKDLHEVIIPHLISYPLISKKQADFKLFNNIVDIVIRKDHLTIKGLQKIVSLKASLNKGLKKGLKVSFPNTIIKTRPVVNYMETINPYWLSAFIDGEGCFFISIYNSLRSKSGIAIQLVFKITQHSRDFQLLKNIALFFDCGRIEKRTTKACDFTVNKLDDLHEKIIPFLLKYPLHSSKSLNFKDFCRVILIMKTKGHLTKQGLDEIKIIKAGMNTKR